MLKSTTKLLVTSAIASILLTGCNNYEQSLKVLPTELAQANQCISQDKEFEENCYDLISYKNTIAILRLGIKKYSEGKYKDAFTLYTLAQQRGNFYANALLSELYLKGRGVVKNQEIGIDLLKDTKKVDPMAAYKLSFYYLNEKDYDEVIELLTFAANNNVKNAQLELSKIYANGKIVKPDTQKSIFWLEKFENKTNSFMMKIYGIW